MDGTRGCRIVYGGVESLHVDLQAPTETPLYKNKEEKGSARAWPVAAPMPKSDSFFERKERMCRLMDISTQFFAFFFTIGVAMYL